MQVMEYITYLSGGERLGYRNEEEMHADGHLYPVDACGFLVKENSECVVLCTEVCEADYEHQYSTLTIIPKVLIRERLKLEVNRADS